MLKTRPIISITLGYIIGIIIGLYFNFSIVFFYLITFIIKVVLRITQKLKNKNKQNRKINILKLQRYFRYLKIIFTNNVIIIIILSSIISNTIILYENLKYDNLYNFTESEEIIVVGRIITNAQQKEYKDYYIIKVEKINNNNKFKNTKLYVNIKKNKNIELQYGDKIKLQGNFIKPSVAKNYKGFNYKEYLKILKIYGTVELEKYELIEKNTNNVIFRLANNYSSYIKNNVNKTFDQNVAGVILGLTIGYTDEINDEIKLNFSKSNISHILAISGLHISCLTVAISFALNNIIGKRNGKIFTSLFLTFYMIITNFSPSVVRASLNAIIVLFSGIFHRKSDLLNNICLSLLILLIYNPYLIKSISVLLSFGGTIGIVLFNKNILRIFEILEENLKEKNKRKKKFINFKGKRRKKIKVKGLFLLNKAKELISVCISANIMILPIIAVTFNQIPIFSLFIGILISSIISPIIIICLLYIIFNKLNILAKVVQILISFLIKITELGSNIKLNTIYTPTPYVIEIIIYYIIIFLSNDLFQIYNFKKLSVTQKRIKNTISLIKYKLRIQKITILQKLKIIKFGFKKVLSICLIIIIIISNVFFSINQFKKLKIYFIDVGQGDSTLIITENNKKILIDGGGSEMSSYNIGKNVLLPYLLDRKIKVLDYVIISHFDTDHSQSYAKILPELRASRIFITEQIEENDLFKQIMAIAKEKNIKVTYVKAGDIINIDGVKFSILHPQKELITNNGMNNNSMVCKLEYKSFSMLFTGDIEKEAEELILSKNTNLKADVLKVAHHRFKNFNNGRIFKSSISRICIDRSWKE